MAKKVEERKEEPVTNDKAVVKSERQLLFDQLADQYKMSLAEQTQMIRSVAPLTEKYVKLAVAVAKAFGLPLQGINMIPVGNTLQPYVNSDGLRWRIHTDSRGVKKSLAEVIHKPTKDEPWVEVVATIVMGDDSEYTNLGVVACTPGPDVANSIMKATCVPLDSEILTRDGFKRYSEVAIGEDVLAYNVERNVCEWTPLLNITVHDNLPIYRFFTDRGRFEVFCTQDHSWATVVSKQYKPDKRTNGIRGPRGPYKNRGSERKLLPANEIKTSHKVIMAAPEVASVDNLIDVDGIEILGWGVTDGTIKKTGNSRTITVCQSKEENISYLRELFSRVAPDMKETSFHTPERTFPMSGKTYQTKRQYWWAASASATKNILETVKYSGIEDLPKIVTRISIAERESMLRSFMMAEGDKRGVFANTNQYILEAFQILCALQGIFVTAPRVIKHNGYKTCYYQRKKKTKYISGNNLNLEYVGIMPAWCPTTAYGTWIMRQNGNVCITGNTKAKRRASIDAVGVALPIAEDYLEWVDEQKTSGKIIDGSFTIQPAAPAATTEPKNLAELLAWITVNNHTVDEASALVGDPTQMSKDVPAAYNKLKEVWKI